MKNSLTVIWEFTWMLRRLDVMSWPERAALTRGLERKWTVHDEK